MFQHEPKDNGELMFRTVAFAIFSLALFCLPQSARATVLTSCPDCDGDLFAITFSLESDNGITSVFDVSLLADTSGNNLGLGPAHINAVAIGLNGITVQAIMDAAPNGAANWTGQGGGLSSSGAGGCDGHGAFICAQAASGFGALAPNAATASTPYVWTWDVEVADSTQGGAASVFASGADVKVNYSEFKGHHVSDTFTFGTTPRVPTPEPMTSALIGAGLISLFFLRRRISR
jgi:hypothetical protein